MHDRIENLGPALRVTSLAMGMLACTARAPANPHRPRPAPRMSPDPDPTHKLEQFYAPL